MQALKGISQSCGLDGSPESALWWIGSLKENYILIFDNADVLSPAALEVYFPPGMRGNILITSCNFAVLYSAPPIPAGILSFLWNSSGIHRNLQE